MPKISDFPLDSHLRVFHAPRGLSPDEKGHITTDLTEFVENWSAEKRPVTGAFEIVHDQFIVFAADETIVPLTG